MEPVAQGRPKFSSAGGFVRAYDPKKSRDAKSYIRMQAAEAMGMDPLFTGPVAIEITAFRATPKSTSGRKAREMIGGFIIPTTKPDMSNYLKLVEDALNGIIWRDDSQIVDSLVRKRYGLTPGYEIIVREYLPEVEKESGDAIWQKK